MGFEPLIAATQPWADVYGGSVLLSTFVEFLHLGGLLVAGGFALAFDRAALRVSAGTTAQRSTFLDELSAVHRFVLIGLAVVLISGLALLLANLEAMLPSNVFRVKMAVLVLLLVNGVALRNAGERLRRGIDDTRAWRALRAGACCSITLWGALLLLGVLLTSV